MTLYPTRATFHVAVAGAAVLAVGIAARAPSVAAFGGGIILALAVGRALALTLITRLRAAGFDLKWIASSRVVRLATGAEVTLELEIRNWGAGTVRAANLRATASSMLETEVEPSSFELTRSSSTRVRVHVRGKRVGRWCIHGLALEVRGAPAGSDGSYEVPLVFHSPFGVEVLPRPLASLIQSSRGGRARHLAEAGRPSRTAGEGDELRELREHVPGDPFKRIAWKASARRGQLLVRETDRSERETLWLVVDASVELWAGPLGRAPLDRTMEEVAAFAARNIARGNRVGLFVTATRERANVAPDAGAPQAAKIAKALAGASSMVDEDRTELDDRDVALRILEHAQATDPRLARLVALGDLGGLARRADARRAEAPFSPRPPFATTDEGRALRHYLAAFGIEVPPRLDGERERTDASLASFLEKLAAERDRPSSVHVWAGAPARRELLGTALRRLRMRRVDVFWHLPALEDSVASPPDRPRPPANDGSVRDAVEEAVRVRARAELARGARMLRQLGARGVIAPSPRGETPSPGSSSTR